MCKELLKFQNDLWCKAFIPPPCCLSCTIREQTYETVPRSVSFQSVRLNVYPNVVYSAHLSRKKSAPQTPELLSEHSSEA